MSVSVRPLGAAPLGSSSTSAEDMDASSPSAAWSSSRLRLPSLRDALASSNGNAQAPSHSNDPESQAALSPRLSATGTQYSNLSHMRLEQHPPPVATSSRSSNNGSDSSAWRLERGGAWQSRPEQRSSSVFHSSGAPPSSYISTLHAPSRQFGVRYSEPAVRIVDDAEDLHGRNNGIDQRTSPVFRDRLYSGEPSVSMSSPPLLIPSSKQHLDTSYRVIGGPQLPYRLPPPSISSDSDTNSAATRNIPISRSAQYNPHQREHSHDSQPQPQPQPHRRNRLPSQSLSDRPTKSPKFAHSNAAFAGFPSLGAALDAAQEEREEEEKYSSTIRHSWGSSRTSQPDVMVPSWCESGPSYRSMSTSRLTPSLDGQLRRSQPFSINAGPSSSAYSQLGGHPGFMNGATVDDASMNNRSFATTPLSASPSEREHHEAALRLASFAVSAKQEPSYNGRSVRTAEVGTWTDEDWPVEEDEGEDGEGEAEEQQTPVSNSFASLPLSVTNSSLARQATQGAEGSSNRNPGPPTIVPPQKHEPSPDSAESSDSAVGSDMQSMSTNSNVSGGGSGKYACDVCHRRFTRPSALAVHSHMHTGAKPFTCAVCTRSFSVNSNLRRHLRTHSKTDRDAAGVQ